MVFRSWEIATISLLGVFYPVMGEDLDLLAKLARNLEGCFEELVLAYQDRLYAFALRMTGDHHDAEEVAQETFVRAYRALGGYGRQRIVSLDLRPWLYTIALNTLRNKRRGRRVLVSFDGSVDVPSVSDEYSRADEASALASLLSALPAKHRAALLLRYFEDLSFEEIAAVLGQPVGSVKSNVHRGLARLRSLIGGEADV